MDITRNIFAINTAAFMQLLLTTFSVEFKYAWIKTEIILSTP